MRSKFDEQLRELNAEMIEMGRMIVQSISQAIEALTTQNEELAKKILTEEAVEILVELEDGNACGTAWGCDLTYDYVKINGDYRT